jgi:hypothetical protein
MRLATAALVTAIGVAGTAAAQGRQGGHRVAVIVGANATLPGRQPLLYSHRDAAAMAEILAEVGGFRPDDIRVLEDPTPDAVVEAVAAASRATWGHPDSLLYFYYSGHADERSLYPGGRPLPLERLRGVIDGASAAVKIGMVDACRGGAWTRAKGLSPEHPFAIEWPVTLENEGSVLIASSSGVESAHEADHLRGSFFTTHFIAGLRGAADRDGNGEVTLTEAFEYAKERTIRDSARLTRETQHPSYAVSLRGRRDLVLAQLGRGTTTMEVTQEDGPLSIIHLDSGVELLELAPGRRAVRLAVPPGRYLVRKTVTAGQRVKELTVPPGGRVQVAEGELTLVAAPGSVTKAVLEDPFPEPLPFRVLLAPFVAVGTGWGSGTPDVNPTDTRGNKIQLSGVAGRAGLLTVGADAAVMVTRGLLLGAELRYEIVTGASTVYDVSCPGGSCRPPGGALAGLATAGTIFKLSDRLHLLAKLRAGMGEIRHLVRLEMLNDCGAAHADSCIDTLASGPWLLGGSATVMYELGQRWAVQGMAGTLLGFPRTGLDLELGAALAMKY